MPPPTPSSRGRGAGGLPLVPTPIHHWDPRCSECESPIPARSRLCHELLLVPSAAPAAAGSCVSNKEPGPHRPAPASTTAELSLPPPRQRDPLVSRGTLDPALALSSRCGGRGTSAEGFPGQGGVCWVSAPQDTHRDPTAPLFGRWGHGETLLYPSQCFCQGAKFLACTNNLFVQDVG